MDFKYKVNAISKLGDIHENGNEYYYADGLSSVENGMCASSYIKRECRGRKHIFAIASEPNNVSRICDIFSDSLSKSDSKKHRIKIQYELKDMMTDIRANQSAGNDDADLSVVYIEGGNVYAAGFGNVCIYRYVCEKSTVEKVVFPSASVSDNETADSDTVQKFDQPRSKLIAPIKNGDRYLVVSPGVQEFLGEEEINKMLSHKKSNPVVEISQKDEFVSTEKNSSAICIDVKKSVKNYILALCAVILAALIVFAVIKFIPANKPDSESGSKTDVSQGLESAEKDETQPESFETAAEVSNKHGIYQIPLVNLEGQLDEIASAVTGDNCKVSYYVKNLISGDVVQNNSDSLPSASVNNLFVMATVFQDFKDGLIVMDDNVYSDISSMITLGDNGAANRLVTLIGNGDPAVGFQRVTEFAESVGCTATKHNSDLQTRSVDSVVSENYTSVSDCGIILEKIYRGELVDSDSSTAMLELLKDQQRRVKIPKYLPNTAVIANKTGETDSVQNDVAIVISDKSDYIICIMINDYSNTMDEVIDIVARMSEAAYKYINA